MGSGKNIKITKSVHLLASAILGVILRDNFEPEDVKEHGFEILTQLASEAKMNNKWEED